MLSLTGSLLVDPSKPQTLPEAARRSPSPDLPEPPKRAQRTVQAAETPAAIPAKATPSKSAAPETTTIDESKLSARELKKLRKEQEKAKRDARKARRAEEEEPSLKRKADEAEGPRKKRKE